MELVKGMLHSGRLKIDDEARGYLIGRWDSGMLLHLAAEHNDLDLASYVLQHESFDPSNLDKRIAWSHCFPDETALDTAQKKGFTEVANLLIAHGAINRNLAPEAPCQASENPPQPSSSQDSGSDLKMHEASNYEPGSDIEDP